MERRAVEEADVDMTLERVDVRERCIFYAHDRTTVVHQLSDVVTARSHPHEPAPRDRPKFDWLTGEPRLDVRIPLHRPGDAKDFLATAQAVQVQRNATRFAHQ